MRSVWEVWILTTDDRPTDLRAHSHILKNFKWPYLSNASSDRLHVWFWGEISGTNYYDVTPDKYNSSKRHSKLHVIVLPQLMFSLLATYSTRRRPSISWCGLLTADMYDEKSSSISAWSNFGSVHWSWLNGSNGWNTSEPSRRSSPRPARPVF